MKRANWVAVASLLAMTATPATAEVLHSSENGFATQEVFVVDATPAQVWAKLIDPAQYWNPEHSWIGDAGNFTLEAKAGGCFCEAIPAKDGNGVGSVEHAGVIYAAPGKMLRMRGSLGPLQGEALTGTLTVTLIDMEGTTAIQWEYVVGGYARYPLKDIAGAVDSVQTEQLTRLASLFPSRVEDAE